MCNTQTKGVELQGNANAVANVKNVEIKPEILKLQEFITDWYGENTKQASNHLRSIFFEFVNQSLKNDACLLATYENELFLLQNLIKILDVETQTFVFNENEQQRTINKQEKEITELKKTIHYKEELIQAQEQEIKTHKQLIELKSSLKITK